MNIKEMIEWLETLDPELEVSMAGYDGATHHYTNRPFSVKLDVEVGECSLDIEKGAGYE
tara:strand:+ start:8989 stop:9165 length:177 start_codon:yes stop_codon:yes gene_type:complete